MTYFRVFNADNGNGTSLHYGVLLWLFIVTMQISFFFFFLLRLVTLTRLRYNFFYFGIRYKFNIVVFYRKNCITLKKKQNEIKRKQIVF